MVDADTPQTIPAPDEQVISADTEPNGRSSSPMTCASDAASEDLSMQAVAVVNSLGIEERGSAESRPGGSGEEQEVPHASKASVTQGAVHMAPVADFASQVHHGTPSMPGLLPHLHGNGHFPQGAYLRPPSNGMYGFASDIMPSQAPLQHPGPVGVHHPQPFGYFPVGTWAMRANSGVLPLPQGGGYGPGGLAMGVLPPMSLAVPGAGSPVGLGLGHLPAIPDGLSSLQLGDHQRTVTHSVFLSRFGASPGRGAHGRVLVERTPAVSDGPDFNDPGGHLSHGLALSNGSSSLPGLSERRHAESPTSTADFSFFHSKWPISGENDSSLKVADADSNGLGKLSTSGAERTQCIGGSDLASTKPSLAAGEYSLFASAPSNGFGFF